MAISEQIVKSDAIKYARLDPNNVLSFVNNVLYQQKHALGTYVIYA